MTKRRSATRKGENRPPASREPQGTASSSVPANPLHGFGAAIFFASGFAGLIYESIWTHYLKLFLGHAAYAQTLVLAIFMGGMAVGAALAARRTIRLKRPLLAYAAIELAIGVLAIGFHPVFVGATEELYRMAFDWRLAGGAFDVLKWGVGALLILPQSILLGATFPVFAASATRHAPSGPGRPIATLYFANSIGGSLGVLVSGFVLIPDIGLPGTMIAAGLLNLVIAALVARLARAAPAVPTAGSAPVPGEDSGRGAGVATPAVARLLVAAAFVTGLSSFVYEIGWIRMLSLVLGSATHSFELMLSSFILGLALGGFWIRSRIDKARHPGRMLAYIQIAMGAAALATIPLHSLSFDAVAWVLNRVPRTDEGYAAFNVVRYGLASLIMFPAAFCAGMTLPLVTRLLFATAGQGERAIGVVYSANTIGGILGVVLAVHFGLPLLGIEYLVSTGALIDVALGAVLLGVFGGRARLVQAGVAIAVAMGAAVAAATSFDPQKMVSGVFRTGKAVSAARVIEIAHGKTATISVEADGDVLIIRTNGKPDGSANVRVPTAYRPDEVTERLLGTIPLMLHPAPRRIANIGMGSGVTGEMILGDPRVVALDTVEIEPAVVRLARHFGAVNRRVYDDPRSAIHIDDAKAFFATHATGYDVIVSEPSNPWVSGVSGLFSVEFYRHVARYLDDGGIFVQWLQTYESDPDRIAAVLKAMARVFDDFMVVALDDGDLLLAASMHAKVVMPADAFTRLSPSIREKLRPIGVATQSDVTFRIVGNKALLEPWLATRPVDANSDFFPYLDTHADRDRFLEAGWSGIQAIALSVWPIAEVLGARPPLPTPSSISVTPQFGPNPPWLAARLIAREVLGPDPRPEALPIPLPLPPRLADQGERILDQCRTPQGGDSVAAAARLGTRVLPYLSPAEGRKLLAALGDVTCLRALYGTQAQWRALLRDVADRNARSFGPLAERMLDDGQGATPIRTQYLLGLAMLGRIAAGDTGRARAVWERYAGKALAGEPPDPDLEVLRAHAMVRGSP